MNKLDFQNLVRETVESRQGMKATELAAVQEVVMAGAAGGFELWDDALTPLIDTGDIIEIEYVVPNIPDRLKSFLLPRGSIITALRNNGHYGEEKKD